MSTPNPMSPQSSLLEQKAKRKTNLPVIVAVFLGIHIVVLGGILMAGCKPEPKVETRITPPEPPLPQITPPADLGSPVTAVGGAPTPAPLGGLPPLAPAPTVLVPTPPTVVAPLPVAPTALPMPEPLPTPTSPPLMGEPKTHVVAKNDTFSTMAKKYGVSVKAIGAANPGVDSTKLKLKQKITIPVVAPKAPKSPTNSAAPVARDNEGVYTIKSGDNLGNIAKRHGTSVAKLREANGLKSDQIKVGQKLKVPAGSAKKSAEAALAPAMKPEPAALPVPAFPPALPELGNPVPRAPGL